MQEAVLILIWCFGVVLASEADSWEPHDHEYINHHNLFIESVRNHDIFRENSFSNTLQGREFNETDDFGLFPAFPDNQDMETLLLSVTTEEKKRCVSGHYIRNKCADCVCMGGQLYVCSMKPCLTAQKDSTEEFSAEMNFRRGRPTAPGMGRCVPGKRVTPPDECISCTCRDGWQHCYNVKGCHPMLKLAGQNRQGYMYRLEGKHVQGWTSTSRLPSTRAEKCIPGKPLPMPDACNRCTCLPNRVVYCTSVPCHRNATTTTRRFTTRAATTQPTTRPTTRQPRECDPDLPVPTPDSCNTCICLRATETISCTNFDCSPSIATMPRTQPTVATTMAGECYPYEVLPAPDSCNTCICRQDGTIYCTTANCNPTVTMPSTALVPEREMECVPFEHLPPEDCNSCYCNEHGYKWCDVAKCSPPFKPSIDFPIRTTKSPKKECIPYQRLPQPDSCNRCFCLANGTKYCTKNRCNPFRPSGCTPGDRQTAPDGCNWCTCRRDRLAYCSIDKCSQHTLLKNQPRRKKCNPNDPIPKPDRCNRCYCAADGTIMCTLVKCHSSTEIEDGMECIPGKPLPKPDRCNHCYCTLEGKKQCTLNKCPPSKEISTGMECIPNRPVPQPGRCNNCYCSDDGKVMCEMKCFHNGMECTPNKYVAPPDSCNKCVCLKDGLKYCTVKKCPHPNNNLIPFGKRPQVLSAKIPKPGSILKRCTPNTKLISIGNCFKCICNKNGKVKCRDRCVGKIAARTPDFKLDISSVEVELCVPGPLPSPDSCNKCFCTENREVMCTARTCTFRLEDNSVAIEDRGCVPQTWFSMSGSKTCKECFCINGKISFCYVNFCNPIETRPPNYVTEQRNIKINKKNRNQRILDIAMELSWIPTEGTECNEGESFTQGAYHSCQGCFCSKERKWQCWSGSRHCQEPKRECELGTIFKNYKSECSVCYCGPENSVVCATDQNCAKSLQ